MFRSLLVPVDLSPASARVIDRAALLPLAKGARLTLLHVVSKRLPSDARGRANQDAREGLVAAASRAASLLPRGATIRTLVKTGVAATEIGKQAQALGSELVVMGRGGGRGLSSIFLGSTAERVVRQGHLPVLVVRLAAQAGYRRPLLALDLDPIARELLETALRVIAPPRPRMSLVHAYDAPYHGSVYPSLTSKDAREYRDQFRQEAVQAIAALLAAARPHAAEAPSEALSWKSYIRYGSARAVIQEAVEKARADLLVIGTHAHSAVTQAFLGSVAGDVLREVPCDVLVVPPRRGGKRSS